MTKRAMTSGMSAKHPIIPAEECQPNPQPPRIGAHLANTWTASIVADPPDSSVSQSRTRRKVASSQQCNTQNRSTNRLLGPALNLAERILALVRACNFDTFYTPFIPVERLGILDGPHKVCPWRQATPECLQVGFAFREDFGEAGLV